MSDRNTGWQTERGREREEDRQIKGHRGEHQLRKTREERQSQIVRPVGGVTDTDAA